MRTTAAILEEVLRHAPHVTRTLADAHDAAWASTDPTILELCRLRVARLLGNEHEGATSIDSHIVSALPEWPTSPWFTEAQRACLAFTEEFVMDVASLSDATALGVVRELGDRGFVDFVNSLLVVEQRQRFRLAFTELFPDRAA